MMNGYDYNERLSHEPSSKMEEEFLGSTKKEPLTTA